MELVIDIETVPAQRSDVLEDIRQEKQAALQAAIAAVKPPGNYKKQETIDEWLANEAPKAIAGLQDGFEAEVDKAYRMTGLDGSFGQVCVVGLAVDEQPAIAIWNEDFRKEYAVLTALGAKLQEVVRSSDLFTTTVIGHNVSGFDLRFLMQRYVVHGLKPHPVISRAAAAKPWESDKVFDTMIQWGGIGAKAGGSLDKLCRALSIPTPKGDITGATVWDAVKAGRLAEVAAYCIRDVEATRQIYRRIAFRQQFAIELPAVETETA